MKTCLPVGHDVDSETNPLQGRSEDELTGVEHEGLFLSNLDQLGQIGLRRSGIDLRVTVIDKNPETVAHPEIYRGRLDEARVVRFNGDLAGRN